MALITKECSTSDKLASLSPKALALYFLVLAQLNNHGKMKGAPAFIKEDAAPKIMWLSLSDIEAALREITAHTNIKWFRGRDGMLYLHSLNFHEHNPNIRKDRLGADRLPSYSNEPTPIISVSAPIASPGEDAGSGTPGAATALYVPGVLSKPLITFAGEWKGITEAHMTLWAAKYPLVDIEAKLDDLGDWIKKNINEKGKRGKDARHYAQDGKAFIQRCLLDDQKRLAAHAPAPSPGKPTPEEIKAHNDALRQSEAALLERRKI